MGNQRGIRNKFILAQIGNEGMGGYAMAKRRQSRGQSLIESFLLLALVAVVCFASVRMFGQALSALVDDSCTKLVNAMAGA